VSEESFDEICRTCEMRNEMKKRVTYSVLTIILGLTLAVSSYFSYSVHSAVAKIERTVDKLTDRAIECGNRTTRLETQQEVLNARLNEHDQEIHQLRNVTQFHQKTP